VPKGCTFCQPLAPGLPASLIASDRRSRLGRLRAQPRPHLRRKLSPARAFETPRPEQGIGYYCLAACRGCWCQSSGRGMYTPARSEASRCA
jgi:hypothetical protein